MFYEHVDTRIYTNVYLLTQLHKIKTFDNDIKTKSISKTCSNYETKGKLRENVTSRYRTRITKTQCARGGTVQRLNHSARDP